MPAIMPGPVPQDVADKVARLVPRLSSEHDGEIIATVKAIERVLKSSGFDFHNLAASVQRSNGPAKLDTNVNAYGRSPSKPPPPVRRNYSTIGQFFVACFEYIKLFCHPTEDERNLIQAVRSLMAMKKDMSTYQLHKITVLLNKNGISL